MSDEKWDFDALARELLNREYGPSRHPADPGRNFTVTFRTAPHKMQERDLAAALRAAFDAGKAAQ